MTKSTVTYLQLLIGYTTWWLFWAVTQVLLLHHFGASFETAIVDALVSNLLLAIGGFIIQNTYRYYQPGSGNRFQSVGGGGIILIIILVQLSRIIIGFIYADDSVFLRFFDESIPIRYAFFTLMIVFLTAFSWLWYGSKEQSEIKSRQQEAEKLLKDAELSRLRQQLNPHFLFNSLNSISALAGSKPELARKMIQQLSEFLRGTLKKDELELVALDEEMHHLSLYLEIEKVRFGHRLNIEIETSEDSKKMKLPSLLLQPIVENAIKFGLYDTTDQVTIIIKAQEVASMLEIIISNPYDMNTAVLKQGEGFGLSSVQRRLQLIYARPALLTIKKEENKFTTSIHIPQL